MNRYCRRYFPEQERNKTYRWTPEYFTDRGTPFPPVEDVECDDCPVSLIHGFKNGQSMRWLEFRSRIVRLKECGVQAFGPGEITSKEADILLTIQNEEDAHRVAQYEAEAAERGDK